MSKKVLIVTSLMLVFSTSYAADTKITNKITGVGFDTGKEEVHLCYNHVEDEYNYNSGNVSPSESFRMPRGKFTNFNARLGGCSTMNTYLGNFTVSSDWDSNKTKVKDYTHEDVAMVDGLSLSNNNIVGSVVYIPPEQVELSTPKQSTTMPMKGINISGNEFGKYWSPVNSPEPAEMQAFIDAGMTTFRLPIRWAYLQPEGPGVGDLDANYLAFIKNFLENATRYKVNVILDMHNYLRYSKVGVGFAGVPAGGSQPDGEIVQSAKPMVDVWGKLVSELLADSAIDQEYLSFDLSNEPTLLSSVGGTEVALEYQNAIIAKLRDLGADNLILVEGSHWTGLHSWSEKTKDGTAKNSDVFTKDTIVDPANNFAINVHQYFDEDFSGTHDNCVAGMDRYHMEDFVNYLKDNKFKAIVTEFGAARGDNCMGALDGFLALLEDNAYTDEKGYGFIGWTAWSAGHAWGDYNLRIEEDSPQMDVFKKYLP